MRTPIYNFIRSISAKDLGSFSLSEHLPWEDNGAPIYHHNKKFIYVNNSNTVQEPVYNQLNMNGTVVSETITVQVYFVCDAKQLPTNYESLVEIIKLARLVEPNAGFIQRLCQVTTEYNADSMLTTFEFSFRKLITTL